MSNILRKEGYRVDDFADPVSAAGPLQSGRFDMVVSDLHFIDIQKSVVESFLKECVARGLPVVLLTASEWHETPADIEGIIIVPKPVSLELLFESIEASLERRSERRFISEETIRRLMNPDRHVQTPLQKWGSKVLDQDSSASEKQRYSMHLEYQYLQGQLDSSFASGHWHKRDLNNLMDRYSRLKIKLNRKSDSASLAPAKRHCLA